MDMNSTSRNNQLFYDVVIAGYGPTGATLANLLGKRGFKVAVLDKETEIYDKPRAITADHEVMRIFQACGLADEIAAATVPHPGTDYIGLENQIIKRFYPAPQPHPLSWDPTWMFIQPKLEASLRRGLERFESVHTYLGHEITGFEEREDGVRATVKRLADEHVLHFNARYLVGCDGARSLVRRQLDSVIEDQAFDEWWIVVDAWLRGDAKLPQRATQYCHPWRPGSFIVGPDDLRRWEIKLLPDETPESFESADKLQAVLSHFVDTSQIEIYRTAIYRFHALVVDDWGSNRVFLMGDAAHQTPPFLGQGMCAGIRDADNLAWKLDGVEHLGYRRELLATYTPERKPHVRTVISHAKEFGLIIGELDRAAAQRRDQLLGEQLRSGIAETVRQKFIPGLEAGLIARRKDGSFAPAAGDLFIPPWVHIGSTTVRLDEVLGQSFALVLNTSQALDWIGERQQAVLNRLQCKVVVLDSEPRGAAPQIVHAREEGELAARWFDAWDASAALVRPDHYVFGCAASMPALGELLEQLSNAIDEGAVPTDSGSRYAGTDSLMTHA